MEIRKQEKYQKTGCRLENDMKIRKQDGSIRKQDVD